MKRSLVFLFLLILAIPISSHAFLNSSDPTNIFSILAKAPWVLRVKVVATQNPTGKQRYFIQELKVEEVLSGQATESKLKTLQETLLLQDRSAFPGGSSALAALAPLPSYTAYAAARDQGAAYRLFGGSAGVLALDEEGKELLSWSRKFFEAKAGGAFSADSHKSLLVQALGLQSARWVNEASLALGELALPKNSLSAEEVARILALLQDARLKSPGQIALVHALQQSAAGPSLEALEKLAEGPPSAVKWASIRALEDLGYKRSLAKLKTDFQGADEAGKLRALAAVLRQRDADAAPFLRELLNGPESLAVKREAIDSLARIGGVGNESLLLDQLGNADLQVVKRVILALGRMQSSLAVPKLLLLVDSPSPQLRSAAIMALNQSNDPRARKLLEEKFPPGGEGHTH